MEDWEEVSFLKSKSLPQHLQQAISNLCDTSTIFSLLDTQYGDKSIEIATIKRKIIGDTPLVDQPDLNQRLERVKVILKYLSIFRQHFNYIENLRINEVSQSLMTWLPGSNYTNELYSYLKEVSDNLCNKNIPVAHSYYALLVRASDTLTALQADHNNYTLTKQIPNLNIQTKGIPQTPQVSAPKQIILAKRENPAQK